MENNMVKLDEILEAVKYKEAAKKKRREKELYSLDSGDYRHRCGCGSSCLCGISLSDSDYLEDFDDDFDDDFEDEDLDKEEPEKKLPKRRKRTKDRGDIPSGADRSRFLCV